MLDASLESLVKDIKRVANSHRESPSNKTMMDDNWQFIFKEVNDWIVLNTSSEGTNGYWMHPMLYPAKKFDNYLQNCHEYHIDLDSTAYSHIITSGNHSIGPFWGENNFNDSEIPIYFNRFYHGRPKGSENYIEFNQLVTHLLDFHWSPNRKSYCLINDMGEEVDKIMLVNTDDVNLIVIKRDALDKLLYLGEWVLLRYFGFRRTLEEFRFCENSLKSSVVEPNEFQGKYHITTFGEDKIEFSEFRGVEVLKPITSKTKILSLFDEENQMKQYASFIVQDWKNKKLLKNYSINPENFANYFQKSQLPYETSPIFFNAEVLDKYKNNADKYIIDERTITCRGGWYLQSFDINEYNQVHTYAIDLSKLPYKEQLHWKQYNEQPNGTISKRAIQNDFEAQPWDQDPPLMHLKISLEKLGSIKLENNIGVIWSPKGGNWQNASKGLFELKTENSTQWHNFTSSLANTVIEGFQKKTLKKIADYYGNTNTQIGSLGLLKFILTSTGNENNIDLTYSILSDLQKKRSKGQAHGNWDAPTGSFIKDADETLSTVIMAVEKLYDVFSSIEYK